MKRPGLLVAAFALLCVPAVARTTAPPPATCDGLDAEAILLHTRNVFHSHATPAFVEYTISRRETVDGMPNFTYTYQTRVWYRASDGAALTRRIVGGVARGGLVFEKPQFNAALDPGPPTADIFQRAPSYPAAVQTSAPESTLPVIGSVSTQVESDYRATILSCDEQAVHLQLEPRREPDRNRLRDLWIDRASGIPTRFVATDRLYHGLDFYDPDTFDSTLGEKDGVPVVRTIHGDNGIGAAERDISDYTFEGISFPATLPNWYFEPSTYRAHIAEAPSW